MIVFDLQLFGGRGSGSDIPDGGNPGGGGGGGEPMDENPGSPDTLAEALGDKGRPMSDYNAVMKANPFYDGSFSEYSENCQRAVIATEARFRGYDVIAQPTYDGDTMPFGNNWANSFNGGKVESIGKTTVKAAQRAIESKMQEYGDNSRAILAVEWKGRGNSGHVINIVHRGKQTYYYDGQTGNKYKPENILSSTRTKNLKIMRVDNLDFSDKAREAVRQRPGR